MDLEKLRIALEQQGAEIKAAAAKFEQSSGLIQTFDNRLKTLENSAIGGGNIPPLGSVSQEDLKKFSFCRLLNAISSKNWKGAEFEESVVKETMEKAMAMGTGSAGGYLVPPEYIAEIIEMLRAKPIVVQLGATILDGLTGSPVTIPSQTGGATGYWVGENSAISASDQTLGQLSLTPKKAAGMTILSNDLIKLANPSAEQMVRNDLSRAIALLIDLAALRGSGSGEPRGIVNTGSIGSVAIGADGGVPTFDTLDEMLYKLELANADEGKIGWAFHPRTLRTLRLIKDTTNQYIWQPAKANASPATIFGFPFAKSTQIPITLTKGSSGAVCSEIYFGNWADMVLALWGGVEIQASTETSDAFAKDQTYVRLIQRVDVGIRHAASFVLCADAKAS